MQDITFTLENLALPKKKLNMLLLFNSAIVYPDIYPEEKKLCSHKHL